MITGITKTLALALALLVATPAVALQKTRHVPLSEFTQLELKVLPDLGTRLTFPFLLTDDRGAIPFHTQLTNPQVFSVSRPVKGNNAIPHNSLVVSVNPEAMMQGHHYLGNLFISAGGYQVTVLLGTTTSKSAHVQDVIFDVTPEARTHLIDEAIKAELTAAKATDQTSIGDQVRREARQYIARIALEKPRSTSVKEAKKGSFAKGGTAEIYLDRILKYTEHMVLLFEVDNRSAGELRVLGAQVSLAERGVLDSYYHCPSTVSGDATVRCALVTEDPSLLSKDPLTFSLTTDRGQLDLTW